MTKVYQGNIINKGITFGHVHIIKDKKIEIKNDMIYYDEIENEILKFKNTREKSISELNEIKNGVGKRFGKEKEDIFEGHIMLIEDFELEDCVLKKIKKDRKNAAFAINEVLCEHYESVNNIDDEYLRERSNDIKDIKTRLLKNLQESFDINNNNLDNNKIIVANDLTPSSIIELDEDKILGIINENNSKNSHSVILSKTLNVPALRGVKEITKEITEDDYIILDGEKGCVIINPNEETKQDYQRKLEILNIEKEELEKLKNMPAITLDGININISANIGKTNDIKKIIEYNADGVGLFRTEFLYMNSTHLPSENEQFEAYKTVGQNMGQKPVIIRTLDIGGDKKLSYFDLEKEENPYLGCRAIRVSFKYPEIFKTQLRAILRASYYSDIKIMFPMIISVSEILLAKKYLKEEMEKLEKDGIGYNKNIEIGIMVETPAAVLLAEVFVRHVDFFSIGTNDLIQYLLAVERGSEQISDLYDGFHPAVIRALWHVINTANKNNVKVSVCGELASDEKMCILLLGMGLKNFSMSVGSILEVKKIIRNIKHSDAEKLLFDIIGLEGKEEIKNKVSNFFKN